MQVRTSNEFDIQLRKLKRNCHNRAIRFYFDKEGNLCLKDIISIDIRDIERFKVPQRNFVEGFREYLKEQITFYEKRELFTAPPVEQKIYESILSDLELGKIQAVKD